MSCGVSASVKLILYLVKSVSKVDSFKKFKLGVAVKPGT